MKAMKLKDAYRHWIQSDEMQPFLEALIKEVLAPFVSGNYHRLHYMLPIAPLLQPPDQQTFPGLINDLCSFLFEQADILHLGNRLQLEDHPENIRSYFIKVLNNQLTDNHYLKTRARFNLLFDNYPDEYLFWVQKKERLDPRKLDDILHESRKYYLAKWKAIPDLRATPLTELIGTFSEENWLYITQTNRKALVDTAFERSEQSLQIKHFLDFLKDLGFFNRDSGSASPQFFDDFTEAAIALKTLNNISGQIPLQADVEAFVNGFVKNIPKKYLPAANCFARAFSDITSDIEGGNLPDVFKAAAEISQGKISKNTVRNHIKDNPDSLFNRFQEAYLTAFGELDGEMMKFLAALMKALARPDAAVQNNH